MSMHQAYNMSGTIKGFRKERDHTVAAPGVPLKAALQYTVNDLRIRAKLESKNSTFVENSTPRGDLDE